MCRLVARVSLVDAFEGNRPEPTTWNGIRSRGYRREEQRREGGGLVFLAVVASQTTRSVAVSCVLDYDFCLQARMTVRVLARVRSIDSVKLLVAQYRLNAPWK